MKTMKYYFILLVCLFLSADMLFAQNRINFVYDSAGNRIYRGTNGLRSSSVAKEDEMTDDEELTEDEELMNDEELEEVTIFEEILSDLHIRVYPNPTTGLLRVEILNPSVDLNVDISLYDLQGKKILSRQTSGSIEIDITGQSHGTYLLKIYAGYEQKEWIIIKK